MNVHQIIRYISTYHKTKMTEVVASTKLIPHNVRGMKILSRDVFLRNVIVPFLKVSDEKVSKITKICKPYFLKVPNFKAIQTIEGTSYKRLFLNPEKVNKWSDLSESDYEMLKENVEDIKLETTEIQLTYDNFNYDTIFKAVLPEKEETVSGFSQIGHIIHLNLRDHQLEYAPLIGQVLVDKIKTCRTVVNKSNIIDNTYRNFKMDVIAGDEDFLVSVKENQCTFQFDFSKVYWNPRLSKEHERILGYIKTGDVLFDVFCGVGPFSIPAAKRKCRVFANDLNPDSYRWLNENAKNNKITKNYFESYNLDGKDFICDVFKNFIIKLCDGKEKIEGGRKIHVTMNLPAMAVEFLKHFKSLISDEKLINKCQCEIIVYVYCFAIGNDPLAVAKQMVIDNIGSDISSNIIDVFDVRNVAPNKEMVRVTFKLTEEIIFNISKEFSTIEPPKKKMCVDSVTRV